MSTGMSPAGKFRHLTSEYLTDKGLQHEMTGQKTAVHVKILHISKKFYLEVVLPEIRRIGEDIGYKPSGTTFFSKHVYVRFYNRWGR